MKVFFMWGEDERSHGIAQALKELFSYVVPGPDYFISDDIEAGTRWASVLGRELSATDFGIVCLTRRNLGNRWIHFEAGAIAKNVEDGHVVPYLVDLTPTEVQQPLGQFQARTADRNDTYKLLSQVGKTFPSHDPKRAKDVFDRMGWDDFKKRLDALPPDQAGEPRDTNSMVREILEVVRSIERSREYVPGRGIGTMNLGLTGPSSGNITLPPGGITVGRGLLGSLLEPEPEEDKIVIKPMENPPSFGGSPQLED